MATLCTFGSMYERLTGYTDAVKEDSSNIKTNCKFTNWMEFSS